MENQEMLIDKFTILVVDDQPANLKVLSSLLSPTYNVFVSNSGDSALKTIESETPDLIILDIMMPEMDGFKVCEIVKSNPKTQYIPIIFLSAKDSHEDISEGFKRGAIDYITKPFNSQEVLIRVANHLQIEKSKRELKRLNHKLEKVNKEKDKLFSIISHDLKGSLGGLVQILQLLLEEKFSDDQEKKHITEMVYNSAKNTYSLMLNLLTWSKIQMNNYEFKKIYIDIHSMLNKLKQIFSPQLELKKILIEFRIKENLLIFADENMIFSILHNLISNSIKFSKMEGKVLVDIEPQEERTLFIIEDSGVGMSQSALDKIFRTDSITSRLGTQGEKGTGLGLLLCKEFIDMHGGKIQIESELEKGTKVSFSLPG